MDFYEMVLDSDVVGPFFENVDMARLIDHQTKFISFLLGGPADYADQRLAQVHAHLGVTHAHFDEIKEILLEALQNAGFDDEDAAAVLREIEARRSVIVSVRDA